MKPNIDEIGMKPAVAAAMVAALMLSVPCK